MQRGLVLGVLLILSCASAAADAILINHTAVDDFENIPDRWLEAAKNLTIHYAHTSHGRQIPEGAGYVETNINSTYNLIRRVSSTEGLPAQGDPPGLRMYDGNPPETYIAPDDYWDGASGMDRTRAVADTGNYDFSMWSWCGQQSDNTVETVQRYLDNMAQLESEYPEMRFILMTGHLGSQNNQYQYSDATRDILKRNNDMVRDYARNNSMIVFDFADIEGHNGTGYCYSNDYHDPYETIVECEWPSSPTFTCAHSVGPNCVRKAKAFWYMMARLAGWDPAADSCGDGICDSTDGENHTTCPADCSAYVNECANWQAEHPEWIFCDDFESNGDMVAEGRYFEYGDDGGDFIQHQGSGINGSLGMRTRFETGEVEAGTLKLGFGRNPVAYMNQGIRDDEDFREVYYRMYMKQDPEWEGNPAKLSRATVFTSTTDWSQAMIGHLWSDGSYHLLLDPASCINSSDEVMCTGYNDFDNLQWLGNQAGTSPIFNGNYDDWLCIEHHVKLNDPGQSNGLQEFWIDNNLEARITGLDFVAGYTDYALNGVFFENYWNAGSVKDQERYWDNIVVSTERVGCLEFTGDYHDADTDMDGQVSTPEVRTYVDSWLVHEVRIDALLSGIREWKRG